MGVTKADIAEQVAASTGITKKNATDAIEAFILSIKESLKRGDKVSLVGFGSFSVKEKRSREGRNPQTGAKIHIPEKKVPVFKAGKALKEAVK